MIIGGVLLLAALVSLVALLARQAGGAPTGVERGSWAVLAMGLFLAGGGLLAAGFFDEPESPTNDKPADQTNNLDGKRPPSEPITDAERQHLAWLHRSTVEVFIDRPSFGMRRMILPLEDIVTAPKLASAKGEDVARKGPPGDFFGRPLTKDRDAHFAVSDFAEGRIFGFPVDGNTQWKLKKVQLVGLMKNKDGVAYDTHKVPGMKDVKDTKDIPTRNLDGFEKDALKALSGGENLTFERHGDKLRAMGPIFAGKRCVSCHENTGQMLGAFSFHLERGPIEKPQPGQGE